MPIGHGPYLYSKWISSYMLLHWREKGRETEQERWQVESAGMLHLKGISVHGLDHIWSCSIDSSQMFAMDRTRTFLGPVCWGSYRSQLSWATVQQALSYLYIHALSHHKLFSRYNTFSFNTLSVFTVKTCGSKDSSESKESLMYPINM